MKKLLLILVVLSGFSAFAQKAMQITIDSPAAGQTLYAGTPFHLKFKVRNSGTAPIMSTDTMLFLFKYNNNYLQTSNGAVYINYQHGDIAANEIVTITTTFPALPITTNGTATFGVAGAFSSIPFNGGTGGGPIYNGIQTIMVSTQSAGIEELAAAKSVKLYPNPVRDLLNITMDYNGTARLDMMDITGRLVNTFAISNGEAKINVAGFNKGIYLYRITAGNGQVIKSGKFTVAE